MATPVKFKVPPELAAKFSKDDLDNCRQQFKQFDANDNGVIDKVELQAIMKNLNMKASPDQVQKIITEVDMDKNNVIDFLEFLHVFVKVKEGQATGFGQVMTKQAVVNKFEGSSANVTHSFADSEKESFVDYINMTLSEDPDLKSALPMDPSSMDIFTQSADGILLCKLINTAVANTIDCRVINTGKGGKKLNPWESTENCNLAINSAKSIGCSITNIGSEDIKEGKPHLLLGMYWQVIKIGLLSKISLTSHPELVALLEGDEDWQALMALPPEQILLRWFNYHLKNAGHDRRVANFSGDLKDSVNYTVLLNQIAPQHCDRKALGENDPLQRAAMVIENSGRLGVKKFIRPNVIVSGNARLNLAFVAEIFNTWPALEMPEDMEDIPDFDAEGTREERAYRMWINSLGVDKYVNNLYEDLKDGLALLQTFDKVQPGIVDWSKVNKNPKMIFKKVENCEYVIVLGKQCKFSLVAIGGKQFVDGDKTAVLALTWQLMRFHLISMLKAVSDTDKPIEEKGMIAWVNETVSASGASTTMDSMRDPTIKNAKVFIDLLNAVSKRTVNYDLVYPGDDDEQCEQNAKYAINVARKVGCCVFLVWEDIVEVKPKMIMTLVAAIMHHVYKNKGQA